MQHERVGIQPSAQPASFLRRTLLTPDLEPRETSTAMLRGVECPRLPALGTAPRDETRTDSTPIGATTCAMEVPLLREVALGARERSTRAQITGDLYKSCYGRVFCFVRKSVNDDEAEEIAHEVFVRLLKVRNLESMQIGVAYLLRIADNLLKRRFERARRYREVLQQVGEQSPKHAELQEASQNQFWWFAASSTHAGRNEGSREKSRVGLRDHSRGVPSASRASTAPAPARESTREPFELDARTLDAVLRHLTSEEQSALRLIVCDGLEYQAAARSLGVPVSTINNWKHRALAKLRLLISLDQLEQPLAGVRQQPATAC